MRWTFPEIFAFKQRNPINELKAVGEGPVEIVRLLYTTFFIGYKTVIIVITEN
mgnify:CR=1 FL=1